MGNRYHVAEFSAGRRRTGDRQPAPGALGGLLRARRAGPGWNCHKGVEADSGVFAVNMYHVTELTVTELNSHLSEFF